MKRFLLITVLAVIVTVLCAGPAWAAPDIAVTSTIVTVGHPKVGTTTEIKATIKNVGDATASGTVVKFYDGDPDANYVSANAIRPTAYLGGDITIPSLTVGQTYNVSKTYTVTNDAYHHFFVQASLSGEANTTNNAKSAYCRGFGSTAKFDVLVVLFPSNTTAPALTAATRDYIDKAIQNFKQFFWTNTQTVDINYSYYIDNRLFDNSLLTDVGTGNMLFPKNKPVSDFMAWFPNINEYDAIIAYWASDGNTGGIGGAEWGPTNSTTDPSIWQGKPCFISLPVTNSSFSNPIGGNIGIVHEFLHAVDNTYNLLGYDPTYNFKSSDAMTSQVTWPYNTPPGDPTNEWKYYTWMLETWRTISWFALSGYVNTSGILTITSPQQGSYIETGKTVTIKAVATDANYNISKVEFYANGVKLGEKYSTPYTWDWTPSAKAVSCNIDVKAYDNQGNVSTSSITVLKGASYYYNKLNKGGSVGVVDPKDGHTATCKLTDVIQGSPNYVYLEVDGRTQTVNWGQMKRVDNGSGLFIYAATVYNDGTNKFAELMIAPYQYPSLDIIVPESGINTNSNIVKVATNYSGKNIPWQGSGAAPSNTDFLKAITYNGAYGEATSSETYFWTMSGPNGQRTMTVSLADKFGTVVTKSVTVNYDGLLPAYVYRGPYGDDWKTISLSIGNRTSESVNIAQYYYCNTGDWLGSDNAAFSRQEVISKITAKIGGIGEPGPLTQSAPVGSLPVWVVDKNQYASGTFSAEKFGTIYWKEVYNDLAIRLGKDGQGRYRVWASASAGSRSSVDAINPQPPATAAPQFSWVGSNGARVCWTDVINEAGYRVEQSVYSGSTWSSYTTASPDLAANTTTYTVGGLNPNTLYSFRIVTIAPSGLVNQTSPAAQVRTEYANAVREGGFEMNPGAVWYFQDLCPDDGGLSKLQYSPGYTGNYCVRLFSRNSWNTPTLAQSLASIPLDADKLNYTISIDYYYSSGAQSAACDVLIGSTLLRTCWSGGWTSYSDPIPTSYRGQQNVTLKFQKRFSSKGTCAYIDNVSISTTKEAAATINDLAEIRSAMPEVTKLLSCSPNPFTGQTTINFQLAKPAQTTIVVYNVMGQVVKTLVNECLRPGYHSIKWDGRDANGSKVAAGVYLYRMSAGDYSATRKLTVLR